MTWDTSWKDITALDGLKRQPIQAIHYNDLIAALKERYNNTEDLEMESRDKVLLPPYGQSRFNSFDPYNQYSYSLGYFDPDMWEDGELKAQYDPAGKTISEWGGFAYASKTKFLDKMAYPSPNNPQPPKPVRPRSIHRSSDMVFFRDALKYCRYPNISSNYSIVWPVSVYRKSVIYHFNISESWDITKIIDLWNSTSWTYYPNVTGYWNHGPWFDDYCRVHIYKHRYEEGWGNWQQGYMDISAFVTDGYRKIPQRTQIVKPHRIRQWMSTYGNPEGGSVGANDIPLFPSIETNGVQKYFTTLDVIKQDNAEFNYKPNIPTTAQIDNRIQSIYDNCPDPIGWPNDDTHWGQAYQYYTMCEPELNIFIDNIAFEYV